MPTPTSILLVFGPTASGKTSLCVKMAQQLDGEVVNADSMQLYAGLPLLTAIPDKSEQSNIPHHLFGEIRPDRRWSTGKWLRRVSALIDQIHKRGRVPILAGGTGLYFEALTKGLAKIPKINEQSTRHVNAIIDEVGLDGLRMKLEKADPAAAQRILGADRQRLIRAYSVFVQTGQKITEFQKNTNPVLPSGTWRGLVLLPNRELLYERINLRFDQMMKAGALEELKQFERQWSQSDLPLHKAIGVRGLRSFMEGKITLEEAIQIAKRDSRRYAKRQMTWARGRTKGWETFENSEAVLSVIRRGNNTG